ncbi:hypothetical protein [Streptomyces sp. NPDC004296]|uniref:hypothetical protein n=1 Tax=Streptomyces sp. NPDC004296 TaxID=3364697 RepID=UPI0036CA7061
MESVLSGIKRPKSGVQGNEVGDWKAFYLADTEKGAAGYATPATYPSSRAGSLVKVTLPKWARVVDVAAHETAGDLKARFGIPAEANLMDTLGQRYTVLRMSDGTGLTETIVPWNIARKSTATLVRDFDNYNAWEAYAN